MKKLAARVKSRFTRAKQRPSKEAQENVVEQYSKGFDSLPNELLCLILHMCGPPWAHLRTLMLVRFRSIPLLEINTWGGIPNTQVSSRWHQIISAQDDLLWEKVGLAFFSVKDASVFYKVPGGDSMKEVIRRCLLEVQVQSLQNDTKRKKDGRYVDVPYAWYFTDNSGKDLLAKMYGDKLYVTKEAHRLTQMLSRLLHFLLTTTLPMKL